MPQDCLLQLSAQNPTERTGVAGSGYSGVEGLCFPQGLQRDAEETPLQPLRAHCPQRSRAEAGGWEEAPGAGSPIHEAREAQRLLPGETDA